MEDMYDYDMVVARLPRGGFETVIHLGNTDAKFFRAAALDADQNIIGSSPIWDLDRGNSTKAKRPIMAVQGIHEVVDLDEPPIELIAIEASDWPTSWRLALLFFMFMGLLFTVYYIAYVRAHCRHAYPHVSAKNDY